MLTDKYIVPDSFLDTEDVTMSKLQGAGPFYILVGETDNHQINQRICFY